MTITLDSWAEVSVLLCMSERGRLSLPPAGRPQQCQPLAAECHLGVLPRAGPSVDGGHPLPPEGSRVAPAAPCQLPALPPGTDCIPVPSCRRASGAPGGILDVESILIALLQRAQEQFWSKSRI